MRVELRLNGLTGLVQHNVRLADSEDEYVRAIKELTSKGTKKTDSDRAEIARLEWFGGLYHDPEVGVYVPAWNVLRCLERGAVLTKEGSTLIRAALMLNDRPSLLYDGPKEPTKLWPNPEFRWQAIVGVQRSKVMRTRPIFRRWSLTTEVELADDVMNLADFRRVAQAAGRSEGLGDGRKLGFGRFTAEAVKA